MITVRGNNFCLQLVSYWHRQYWSSHFLKHKKLFDRTVNVKKFRLYFFLSKVKGFYKHKCQIKISSLFKQYLILRFFIRNSLFESVPSTDRWIWESEVQTIALLMFLYWMILLKMGIFPRRLEFICERLHKTWCGCYGFRYQHWKLVREIRIWQGTSLQPLPY